MGDVAASPNDPIFFFHHTTIDCLLEAWLKENPNNKYPDSNVLGHRRDDYIVPFIPLYTHEDMFKTAENLGYDCTIFVENNDNDSLFASLRVSLRLFVSLLNCHFHNWLKAIQF